MRFTWDDARAFFCMIIVALIAVLGTIYFATARDLDGRYANSALKPWFDRLASGKGLCCSMADGYSVADVDWETRDGHFRVRIPNSVEEAKPGDEMIWVEVPGDAVITEPNRAGRTMVWPMRINGEISIRCFMPGSMT